MLSRVGLRAPTLPAAPTGSPVLACQAMCGAGASQPVPAAEPSPEVALVPTIQASFWVSASTPTYGEPQYAPDVYGQSGGYGSDRSSPVPSRMAGTHSCCAGSSCRCTALHVPVGESGLEQRIGQLGPRLRPSCRAILGLLVTNITDSLPMLIWRGDPYWLYNVAGRPGLEPPWHWRFWLALASACAASGSPSHASASLALVGEQRPHSWRPLRTILRHCGDAIRVPAGITWSTGRHQGGIHTPAALP